MSYLVLARKWRPKTFSEVIGQSTVMRTLQNALRTGRIGHAFLLSGARGVGKTTTARILAKALNCSKTEAPSAEPCLECASCTEIAAGTSMDVQEIDGATHNGVEQVRELRESARYSPARDRFKIWIIDEVHMLSTGAFNALLKTLEEPPPRVKFIFATTEYHKLPDTILSRCQQYDFRLIPSRELNAHLREVASGEQIKISDAAIQRIGRAAEGSVRDGLSLFDQVLSFSGQEVKDEDLQALLGLIDRDLLLGAAQAVAAGDSLALLELVERLSDYGADYRNFTRELLLHFRELLLVKLAPEDSPLVSQIVADQHVAEAAAAFSEEELLRVFDVLTRTETDLRLAQDPRVTLELALLKLVQLGRLEPIADLVARVERLAGAQPSAPRSAPAARPPRPPAAKPTRPVQRAVASEAVKGPRTSPPAPAPPAPAPPAPAPQESAPQESAPQAPAPQESARDGIIGALQAQFETRPSLRGPLRSSQARLEGDELTLLVPPDFQAFAESHREDYQRGARAAFDRAITVKIESGAAGEPAAATPDEQKQDRLRKAAEQEPAVQEALDLFGGRLVDVSEEGH